ncbi:MAG: ABC transporter ATP-binding protein/permease [Rhodospirillaceae bacterium]|nr:ABC transporter ATP-binding protein/permease [Rhodospirillaceae bacterium]
MSNGKSRFLRQLWALTRPYWFSEERWAARGLLAVIVALNLGLVYITVLINAWNNLFFNALQNRDYGAFLHQILRWCLLAAVFIAIAVYSIYLRQMLQIRWRRWLTERFLGDWMTRQAYYRMQLTGAPTDNPDQRIAEDLNRFVDQTLVLSLDLLSNLVTLGSFLAILWNLSGPLALTLGGWHLVIPGYMVWVALVYSVVGTWLTHRIGRPLIGINFAQQRREADFRFALVRLRENAEGVALYGGEADETARLRGRFAAVIANWWQIMRYQKRLTWFTVGFAQVADVFPFLVVAPRYFAGAVQLGGLMQTASAFGRVQGAMSWFVGAYTTLADWKATIDRLTGFQAAVAAVHAAPEGIVRQPVSAPAIRLDGVAVQLPDGRPLLAPVSLSLEPGRSLLVAGPSGAGKSTLFRVLSGLWPFGQGRIALPAGARLLFLPQRPYLPLGSLRDAVAYPQRGTAVDDAAVRRALVDTGLAHLADRLDEVQNWAQVLSPGEQQRIAVARALLQAPDWLFLDEATAALDPQAEAGLYRLIRERLPGATLVSIAHREALAAFHDARLEIRPGDDGPGRLVERSSAAAAGLRQAFTG